MTQTSDNPIKVAEQIIQHEVGVLLNDISIGRPKNLAHRKLLLNLISKISSFMGNIFEHRFSNTLNKSGMFPGEWRRNDPDFPDIEYFENDISLGGIEIKAWFPLSTEITGRFKESQTFLQGKNIDVLLVAWIPEKLFYGRPKILDMTTTPALELAATRDNHYFNPPTYILEEPIDTSQRTRNLQQRNVNGYRLQEEKVSSQKNLKKFFSDAELNQNYHYSYAEVCTKALSRFPYRLDTNFSKIDRIQSPDIEEFKNKILNINIGNQKLRDWRKNIAS